MNQEVFLKYLNCYQCQMAIPFMRKIDHFFSQHYPPTIICHDCKLKEELFLYDHRI